MLKKAIYSILLLGYTAVIYWETVISRDAYPQAGSEWRLFWTYGEIADGHDELIGEVFFNVLMFVPIGLLVGLMVRRCGWLVTVILGIALSFGIELFQLYLKRGLCETDDIIHNTVGSMIGFAMIRFVRMALRKQGYFQDL